MRAGELGGVILVGRWTPREMAATTRQLHAAGCAIGRPILLLVDQEGGWARRLTWAAPAQTARELGRLGPARTRAEASATATALRAVGIDVDLAPVSDTLRSGGFLSSRTFGSEPAKVGNLVTAFIRALQAGRIAATAKHFPGLGAPIRTPTTTPSRSRSPTSTRSGARSPRARSSSWSRTPPTPRSTTAARPPRCV
ncbi:MAG: glycoside hydrolase family 3 N-terminal domain-containing protein [Actinomycetota bacterium]